MMLFLLPLLLLVGFAQAQRVKVKAHDTTHLDNLDRDELLNILGQIENSGRSKSTNTPYRLPSSYSTYAPVSAPTASPRYRYTSTYRPFSAPSTRRASSDIDELINKYKNKKGQPGAPSVEDILRRLRNNSPSAPVSRFSYPGPNYAQSGGSKSPSLPYPTSYDSRLFPSKSTSYPAAPPYPSAAPFPRRSSSLYPTLSPYPSAPSYPSAPFRSSSKDSPYSASGTYGGYVPKRTGSNIAAATTATTTTTRKPKKSFLSRIFG